MPVKTGSKKSQSSDLTPTATEVVVDLGYRDYHEKRIQRTLNKLREIGSRNVVEVGGHPWAMASAIVEDDTFELCATVSAEEITDWPDEIEVTSSACRFRTEGHNLVSFPNYSANVERTRFELSHSLSPDTVVACEIIEHLTRSPHVMLLNINNWLPANGKLLITTPNGAQFFNPLRRGTVTPAYRPHIYQRHQYLYTLEQLKELVQLCGFRIVEAGFWDVYDRPGLSRVYGLLSGFPFTYFQEKFRQTLFLLGEKVEDVRELPALPSVYEPGENWEFIRRGTG